MDSVARNIILSNKKRLSEIIDLNTLRSPLQRSKIFTNVMLDDIYSGDPYDLFEELTSRGPYAFEKFKIVLREAGYFDAVTILKDAGRINLKLPICYRMNSNPVGYCKIINNQEFENLNVRNASQFDEESLFKTFSKIGFSVMIDRNLMVEEMRKSLKDFAQNTSWKAVDSCILCILSHGNNDQNLDVICGKDSTKTGTENSSRKSKGKENTYRNKKNYLYKEEIYEIFNNINCKGLLHKPKILIFVHCRGTKKDKGVEIKEQSDGVDEDKTTIKKRRIPSLSDMIVVHSTLPYHKSTRDTSKGSRFVLDLVSVLDKDYVTDDLVTMLHTVNRQLSRRASISGIESTHVEMFSVNASVHFNLNALCGKWKAYDPFDS